MVVDEEADVNKENKEEVNGVEEEVSTSKEEVSMSKEEVSMSKEEAMQVLERFVDNALLSSASSLRILHGKGDGILRKVVRQKLREYGGNISNIYHPEQDGGGDGVTIVELA